LRTGRKVRITPVKRISRYVWWLVTLAVCMVTVAPVYLAYIDWPGRPGSLPVPLGHALRDNGDLVGNVFVYDFWDNFIDSEHLWRIEAKPELLPLLVDAFDLRELPVADVPTRFWTQPPYWWQPSRSADARAFITPSFLAGSRGPDGDHYLMLYDPHDQVLYAWVKHNF
jgi:hypothetical protein